MSSTRKDEVRKQWLEIALQYYDVLDEKGKRELFEGTCKTASKRWTATELETAITGLKFSLEWRKV